MWFACIYVCVPHARSTPRDQKLLAAMWVLAPLEEQSLFLLTEQSLQTPKHLGVTFMKLTLYVLNFLQYVYMSIHVHTGAKIYM